MAKKEAIDPFRTTDKENRFNEAGHEILNPTPLQPPVGFKAQPSMWDQIRQQVQAMRRLEDDSPETEEDADDFEIEDDPPIPSRWENDMIPSIKETRARIRALQEQEKLYAKAPEAPAKETAKETPATDESKS